MRRALSELESAFLEDHRHLTRGLTDLLAALDRDDPQEATRIADRLDRAVGPHMQFEEEHFYPRLAQIKGPETTRRMYHEHQVGVNALKKVLEDCAGVLRREKTAVILDLKVALDHAIGCGSMLAHLAGLPAEDREALHRKLLALRKSQIRWTQLPSRN